MKPDWNRAGKFLIVEIVRTSLLLFGFWCIAWLPQLIPWQASLGLYLSGMAFTHAKIYREKEGQPSLLDLRLYFQNPGIPLVVLFWPLVWFFVYGPVRLESFTRQRLGLPEAS